MSDMLKVFKNVEQLELFCLIVGVVCLLAIASLSFTTFHLYGKLHELKRKLRQGGCQQQHAFQMPTIQPNEELARRGYSMYSGQRTANSLPNHKGNIYESVNKQFGHQPYK